MNSNNPEYDNFDAGMDQLLRANSEIVRSAMEQEKQERKEEREAKRVSSSVPASSNRDA